MGAVRVCEGSRSGEGSYVRLAHKGAVASAAFSTFKCEQLSTEIVEKIGSTEHFCIRSLSVGQWDAQSRPGYGSVLSPGPIQHYI